jgi:diguanylate cyclase (GGDEF)-like protein
VIVSQAAFDSVPDPAAAVHAQLDAAEAHRRRGALMDALREAQAALSSASQCGDPALVALAQLELGNLHRYVPNAVEAIRLLHAAEHYYRAAAHPLLARALTRQGMTLGDMGDHTRALDLYRETLGIIEQAGEARDVREEATCYGAIGVACTQLDDFEQAEDAYRRSIPLFRQTGNLESICFVYNNLAILRVRGIEKIRGQGAAVKILATQAFDFIEQGMTLNNSEVNSVMATAALYNTRGDLLCALDRMEESLVEIGHSLAAYRQMNLPRGQVDALSNLGETHLKLGHVEQALRCLEEAHRMIRDHELKDHERKLHELFAAAHERNGDAVRALAHFKRYHQLETESQHRETQRKLQQLALRAEIESAMAEARKQRELSAQLVQQNQALDRLAREDALTGIANRRAFDEWLASHAEPAAELRVALLDIDHFKQINDRFSHAAGDAVLREIGRILRTQMRAGDLVARYGGEEFVIVQKGLAAEQAFDALERLRMAVQQHDWRAIDPALAVTISIGLVSGDATMSPTRMLACADERLYEAKRNGRNCVVAC